jgi:hypothetical protein
MAGDWFIAYGTNHHWPCISFLGCYLVHALEGELEIVALLAIEIGKVCRHTSRAKPSPTAAAENSIAVTFINFVRAGGERKMQDKESPFVRYRRLARESLEAAKTFHGEQREAFLQMAQVWQRLADQYADSTPRFFKPDAREQPVMQQQQVQSKKSGVAS